MSSPADIVAASKQCPKCGDVKPLSAFYRNRNSKDGRAGSCSSCHRVEIDAARDRRRKEMGEEAFLEWERIKLRVHRQRTGNATGKEYEKVQRLAMRVLRERHRKEFDHLVLLARRGELVYEQQVGPRAAKAQRQPNRRVQAGHGAHPELA